MNKGKSIFITGVMAVMLIIILAGCYMTQPKGFTVLTALLAVYGFLRGGGDLCDWLQKEQREPEHLAQAAVEGDPWAHDDERDDYAPLSFKISGDGR